LPLYRKLIATALPFLPSEYFPKSLRENVLIATALPFLPSEYFPKSLRENV